MNMPKKIAAVTLGCKVNLHDTHNLLAQLALAGHQIVDNTDDADICIVNTCCVTNNADKKSRQAVRRVKARGGFVAVVGCASQDNSAQFKDLGADVVLGTDNRDKLLEYIEGGRTLSLHRNNYLPVGERTRAFLKIQDGCDNFCAYCIIPYVRGRSRSRPFDEVITNAKSFALAGHKEIVVAGICVASYGNDLQDCDLLTVLAEICKIDGIERVRLSSVEPNVITPAFLEFIAREPKFCDHLHLSLQSGSDRILAAMGRKYSTAQYSDAVASIRKILPDVSITTDIIAGFPSETHAEHKQTLDFVKNQQFAALHVFPYSAKKGTKAAAMANQLVSAVKNQRAKEIITLGKDLAAIHNSKFLGRTMTILAENRKMDGLYEGKTKNYIPVYFKADKELEGCILDVLIEKEHKNGLFGMLQ